MNTTIYLIRHSTPLKITNYINTQDNLQIQNEKTPLSKEGELKALNLSNQEEFKSIDTIISSNYVRAMSTAKYIAEKNKKNILIIDDFGERQYGIKNWDELPNNFEQKQLEDPQYKLTNGESRKEVTERMFNALQKVLKENIGKKVVIISHGTAITFLLMKLGKYEEGNIYLKNKIIIDKNYEWNTPEIFKLEFHNKELINIENIR